MYAGSSPLPMRHLAPRGPRRRHPDRGTNGRRSRGPAQPAGPPRTAAGPGAVRSEERRRGGGGAALRRRAEERWGDDGGGRSSHVCKLFLEGNPLSLKLAIRTRCSLHLHTNTANRCRTRSHGAQQLKACPAAPRAERPPVPDRGPRPRTAAASAGPGTAEGRGWGCRTPRWAAGRSASSRPTAQQRKRKIGL